MFYYWLSNNNLTDQGDETEGGFEDGGIRQGGIGEKEIGDGRCELLRSGTISRIFSRTGIFRWVFSIYH
jgi:hypothetical protein